LISTNGKIAIPEYGKNVKVMNQGFRIFQFDWVKLKIKVELSLLKKKSVPQVCDTDESNP
jgi:hypothetical protein